MKILATADIHGSQYRLNILLENIEKYKPDLVVICGEITQFGPKELAKNFLDQIPVETFAISGNIDTLEVEEGINDSKATNIQLKKCQVYKRTNYELILNKTYDKLYQSYSKNLKKNLKKALNNNLYIKKLFNIDLFINLKKQQQ